MGKVKKLLVKAPAVLLLVVLPAFPAWGALTWQPSELADSTGSVGQYASIALDILNRPHIAYYDAVALDLKHAYKDASGWRRETIDSTGDVGRFTSIVVDFTGVCHISYLDSTNQKLKYACGNYGNWQISTVDNSGTTVAYTSLATNSAGLPRIAYLGSESGQLRFAAFDGSVWQKQTVDAGPNVGRYCSLALDSLGKARVSYQDFANYDLKYASETDTGWQIQIAESQNNVGSYSSLCIDNSDRPHIAHFDATNLDLRYTWRDGPTWRPQAVESLGNIGRFCSLALSPAGWPMISYQNFDNRDLKFAYQDTSGWHTQALDGPSDVGQYTRLAVDSVGNAHVAYYDFTSTNYDLKYIVGTAPADTTPPGVPVVVDDGSYTISVSNLHASWTCTDPETGITAYSYSVGTEPGTTDVLAWTTPAYLTSVTVSGLSLDPGSHYYFNVKAMNGQGLWSDVGSSDGIWVAQPFDNAGAAKVFPDGTWIFLKDQTVSAGTDLTLGRYYVQNCDEVSGIRWEFGAQSPASAVTGQEVSIGGRLITRDGERTITDADIYDGSSSALRPFCINSRFLGGWDASTGAGQRGVLNGYGLNNIGLLVRMCGRFHQTGANTFTLDDGRIVVKGICPDSVTIDSSWSYAVVVGISSCEEVGDDLYRVLRVRNRDDIVAW